jgi:hypothetical protein
MFSNLLVIALVVAMTLGACAAPDEMPSQPQVNTENAASATVNSALDARTVAYETPEGPVAHSMPPAAETEGTKAATVNYGTPEAEPEPEITNLPSWREQHLKATIMYHRADHNATLANQLLVEAMLLNLKRHAEEYGYDTVALVELYVATETEVLTVIAAEREARFRFAFLKSGLELCNQESWQADAGAQRLCTVLEQWYDEHQQLLTEYNRLNREVGYRLEALDEYAEARLANAGTHGN